MVTFAVFRDGLFAWRRSTSQSKLLQELNSSVAQLSRWLERSNASSLSVAAGGAALGGLDCIRDDGTVGYNASGQTTWERYRIVYLDGNRQLRWRDQPLGAGDPQRDLPGPIDSWDPGSGSQPLSAYLTGGNVLAQAIESCTFTINGARVEIVIVSTDPDRFRSSTPERVRLQTSVLTRN